MTIDLQTLKCGECGSSVLKRTGLNEYTCAHCGSVTLVEDNVSDRLERVLDQVKDAAGKRLADEQALKQKQALRYAGIALAAVFGISALIIFFNVFFASRVTVSSGARPSAVSAMVDRTIPVEGLKLGEPRQVLAEFGTEIPEDVTVRVHDSLADLRYLVLPRRPEGTQGWSQAQLASIVSRDSMVGVELPKVLV